MLTSFFKRKRLLTLLAVWAVPAIAGAASFDCAKPADSVETAICANFTLSTLDAQLADAYAGARARVPKRAKALKRDQRNWLAERDEVFASNGAGALDMMYKGRVAFLQNAENGDAIKLEALRRIYRALPASNLDDAFSLKHVGVEVPETQRYEDIAHLSPHMPAPPDAHLISALRTLLEDAPQANLVWLSHARVGGVYTMQGTADDESWVMFAYRDHRLQSIETPSVLLQNYNSASGSLALIGGQPVAINKTLIRADLTLQIQSWDGSHWSQPEQLEVHFDHALEVEASSCAEKVNCTDARRAAVEYAKRYSRKPLLQTLADMRMTAMERKKYERMRSLAATDMSVKQLAMCKCSYSDFDETGSPLFPARLHGELVLGRIGHGHIGWRENGAWLVGFWGWGDNRLIPLAGAEIGGTGKFLVAAPMPVVPK